MPNFGKNAYQENSVYSYDLFVCLKELMQGILGRLSLSKAILA